MSFSFKWPRFSDQFHETAIQLLNNALNKGNKPPVIADKIEVVELEMGTLPPELEIRDIGELTTNQFRGIFRMSYAGDAHIVLRTKVQANPLYHKKTGLHQMGGSKGMLAANQPLVVPMLLRLSNFKLNSVVVLVVSKQKGITLVFKTDPLQNVDIHSTFDSIAVIQKFIQKEIEGQLRQMFREDLPGIIHKLSQQWVKKSTTVEAPYLAQRQPPPTLLKNPEVVSNPDVSRRQGISESGNFGTQYQSPSLPPPSPRRRFSSPRSMSARPSLSNLRSSSLSGVDVPYGYETDTPDHPAFASLANIQRESRGLADLAEESREVDIDESESFDIVDWDDMSSIHPSVHDARSVVEYETVPAVGGGVITRPRILHSSSLLRSGAQTPGSSKLASTSRLTAPALEKLSQTLGEGPPITRAARRESWESTLYTEHRYARSVTSDVDGVTEQRYGYAAAHVVNKSRSSVPSHDHSPDDRRFSRESQSDDAAFPTSSASRRSSISQLPYELSYDPDSDPNEPNITLRPGLNNAVSQLSLLNRSNNTLSPFTRTLEHFTIRSGPPNSMLNPGHGQGERQPVKAKRKRIYRLGGATKAAVKEAMAGNYGDTENEPLSPKSVASDFDPSEIDRYFRQQEQAGYSPSAQGDESSPLPMRRRPPRRDMYIDPSLE
ncbi:hypothetical protein SCHPADRAFT_864521 [Schizopora paradoxa]|uniref:Mitochondrial distribution and morphology protein 34 n=1 Tax=Schizopora paradoxa TaxID=27342 RepID=A0A0H2SRX8_9AGAM|nr:hypothetical protein SCHPADRAFT_864521 [Schizopora paradoxa]